MSGSRSTHPKESRGGATCTHFTLRGSTSSTPADSMTGSLRALSERDLSEAAISARGHIALMGRVARPQLDYECGALGPPVPTPQTSRHLPLTAAPVWRDRLHEATRGAGDERFNHLRCSPGTPLNDFQTRGHIVGAEASTTAYSLVKVHLRMVQVISRTRLENPSQTGETPN